VIFILVLLLLIYRSLLAPKITLIPAFLAVGISGPRRWNWRPSALSRPEAQLAGPSGPGDEGTERDTAPATPRTR
jgi:hypothetical protein